MTTPNTPEPVSENQACEVSMQELLRSVPKDLRICIEIGPIGESSRYIPVGVHCHDAADKIDALRAELAESQRMLEMRTQDRNSLHGELMREKAESSKWKEKAEQEERDLEQAVTERDTAEEFVSQLYYLVTGESPEWSNQFGNDQAEDNVKDALDILKSTIKYQISDLQAFKRQMDILNGLLAVANNSCEMKRQEVEAMKAERDGFQLGVVELTRQILALKAATPAKEEKP